MANDDDVTVLETDQYLRELLIPFHWSNSFTWWKENKHCFIQLSQLVKQYLSAPTTSVISESSAAEDIR